MYTGIGALRATTKQAVFDALPGCWSEEAYQCYQDESRNLSECVRYMPLHLAYDEDADAMEDLLDEVPYCDVPSSDLILYAALAAGAGIVVGVLIGTRIKKK